LVFFFFFLILRYDGTAEFMLPAKGEIAVREGYNLLSFDGPGQGTSSRNLKLYFRPDYEQVIAQVATYAKSLPHVNPHKLILWGESFGGYLAPRAFANITELVNPPS
jgi:alpha-beta hydrolase superfamily lysophospholipase